MIPDIKPEWRTSTVVNLCRAIRESGDYSALPILADALQDADCDDTSLLTDLRSPLPLWQQERQVALIMSAETAAAVRWLEQFVRDINYDDNDEYDVITDEPINFRPSDTDPHTYEYIIEQGDVGDGDRMYFGTDAGADYFRASEDNVREFFHNWSLATGRQTPDDVTSVRFSCAC